MKKYLAILLAILCHTAMAQTLRSLPSNSRPVIEIGSWHIYKTSKNISAGCKNPSFVAEANRILRENITDPFNNFKQQGCTFAFMSDAPNHVQLKFKVIQSIKIGGNIIIETSTPMYYQALNKVINNELWVDQSDINPSPVRAPSLSELKASAVQIIQSN